MYNEKDYLEKLYAAKLGNYEPQTSEDDWIKLNSKLSRSRFLKFSFTTFNIFYLAVLFAFAGAVTYMGIENRNLNRKVQLLKENIETIHKQAPQTPPFFSDTLSVIKQEILQEAKNTTTPPVSKPTEPQKIEYTSPQVSTTLQIHVSKADSVSVKLDTASAIKSEPQRIKRVKKTIFVKQDKIIVKDTFVITKKVKK